MRPLARKAPLFAAPLLLLSAGVQSEQVPASLLNAVDFPGTGSDSGALDGFVSVYEAPAPEVTIQVFYFTLCPHCEYFLKVGLSPLIEARLPGDRVKINVVPMYPPLLQVIPTPDSCQEKDTCRIALAPLCAFKATRLRPANADSEELRKAMRFAVCDIQDTARGAGRTDPATQECAEKAEIQYWGPGGIHDCAAGSEAADLLGLGAKPLLDAMELLHDELSFSDPPSMPWILLNGVLLSCDGVGASCTHIQTPSGPQPLRKGGSLLELVCAKMHPPPKQCGDAREMFQQKDELAAEVTSAKTAGEPASRASATVTVFVGLSFVLAVALAARLLSRGRRRSEGLRRRDSVEILQGLHCLDDRDPALSSLE